MRYLLIIALIMTTGCIKKTTDSFSEKLLDEELLVQTLAEELDGRKEEAVALVGKEAERVGSAIAEDVSKIVDKATEDLNKIVERAMDRQNTMVKETAASLEAKHKAFLKRLPFYGLYLILLFWGASLVDDLFRWAVGKGSKWRKT